MESVLTSHYSVCSLYSGSKGNSTLIRTEKAKILIDAGKSAKALSVALASIGESIDGINAIFITHEHTDHIKALEVILKNHKIPVHAVSASAERMLCGSIGRFSDCFCTHPPLFSVEVGDMTVSSFPTPHDSNFSVGYRVDISGYEKAIHIGFATDIGYVTKEIRDALMGCESVVLESNHDEKMLADGSYPYELKKRIASKRGHLSNRECADFAAELCACGTKNLMLAHLSEENNRPEIAFDETFSAVADDRVNIKIADPSHCVFLV